MHARRSTARRLVLTGVLAAATGLLVTPASSLARPVDDATATATAPAKPKPLDQRLLDRLDPLDRALLNELVGYAPPAFTEDLSWHGGDAPDFEALRGKVVILQTWTTKTSAGRSMPVRVARALESFGENVQLIAIHTPEGADTAPTFLERRPPAMPVAIDARGAYCDALGAYKRPVNVIIDRTGAVRGAGVKTAALKRVVEELVGEPFDPEQAAPPQREVKAPAEPAEWPPITGGVGSAADRRGQPAPQFYVSEWVRGRVNPSGKIVVVDFWATWCGPCIASIPHMNALAAEFGGRIAFMGISSESSQRFDAGMAKLRGRDITLDSFNYALALDPSRRMSSALEIRGIPHVMVVSSDGIIRWQGHPTALDGSVLRQIIAADGSGGGPDRRRLRWTQ